MGWGGMSTLMFMLRWNCSMFEVVLISEKTGVQGCMRSYIGKCTQNPLKPPGASQRRSLTSYNLVALPDSGWVEKKIRLGNPSHIKTQVFAETKFSPLSGHNGSEWVVSAMFRQARRLARLKMGRIETAKKKRRTGSLGIVVSPSMLLGSRPSSCWVEPTGWAL